MAKGLEQWKNSLKPSQIAAGMNAASENALRLHEDAELLFNSGRYPSAVSLAILSIEESGKIRILRELALAKDGKDVKEAWNSYRSHTKKNTSWIFAELVSKGARKLEDFRELFLEDAEHPALLDNLKQISFYTDCLGKAHWSKPSKVVESDTAKSIIGISKLMLSNKKFTEREIELWVEHIKPVWKGPMEPMKNALNEWFKSMAAEGLLVEGEMTVSDFIGATMGYNKPMQPTADASAD